MMLTACKEKKTEASTIVIADYEVPEPHEGPMALPAEQVCLPVEWVENRIYQVEIDRKPADSLALVADASGQEYRDNVINLTITRSDNSVFFKKQFTKSSFASLLDEDYRENGLLESIRFLNRDGLNLVFAATVNHPECIEDEAVELKLIISSQRVVSMDRFSDNLRDDLSKADTAGQQP